MDYLDEIEAQLGWLSDRPTPAQIRRLLLTLARAFAVVAEWRQRVTAGFSNLDGRLNPIEERLLIVDTLPTEAPYGALIRVRTGTLAERAALYTGNGPGQPLGKITPTAL